MFMFRLLPGVFKGIHLRVGTGNPPGISKGISAIITLEVLPGVPTGILPLISTSILHRVPMEIPLRSNTDIFQGVLETFLRVGKEIASVFFQNIPSYENSSIRLDRSSFWSSFRNYFSNL